MSYEALSLHSSRSMLTMLGSLIGISLAFAFPSACLLLKAAMPAPAEVRTAISKIARVATFTMSAPIDRSAPSFSLFPAASWSLLLKTRPGRVGLVVGGRVGRVGMVVVGLYWVVGSVGGVVVGSVGRVAGVGDEVWSLWVEVEARSTAGEVGGLAGEVGGVVGGEVGGEVGGGEEDEESC